jgi:hypothetical protein
VLAAANNRATIVSVDGGCDPGMKLVQARVIGTTPQQYPDAIAAQGIEAILHDVEDGTTPIPNHGLDLVTTGVAGQLAVDATPPPIGVGVGNRAGQQRVRHVLVCDGATETLDRPGADGGGAGIGGRRERAAVEHRGPTSTPVGQPSNRMRLALRVAVN